MKQIVSTLHNFGGAVQMAGAPLTVVMATPAAEPELWRRYLRGARDAYRRHGCAVALDYRAVRSGERTVLFAVVCDPAGEIIGGLRIQDRLATAAASHAVEEWAGQSGQLALVNAIEERLDGGISEVKTAWADERSPFAGLVGPRLARLALPIMLLCDTRYIMATAAEHVLARWASGGGRVDVSVPPTPYPDERYVTRLMWIDRVSIALDTRPDVWEQVQRDMTVFSPTGTAEAFTGNAVESVGRR